MGTCPNVFHVAKGKRVDFYCNRSEGIETSSFHCHIKYKGRLNCVTDFSLIHSIVSLFMNGIKNSSIRKYEHP